MSQAADPDTGALIVFAAVQIGDEIERMWEQPVGLEFLTWGR